MNASLPLGAQGQVADQDVGIRCELGRQRRHGGAVGVGDEAEVLRRTVRSR